jgi:hypothetical protein
MFRFAQHDRKEASIANSAADRDHLTIRLVIISEIVLCRFALDYIEKELPQLRITRAGPQRFHDVELQIAAETWTQFPVTCEAKFVAAFAEMQVCHRPDEANALFPTGNLVVRGRTVRPKFRLRNQTPVQ